LPWATARDHHELTHQSDLGFFAPFLALDESARRLHLSTHIEDRLHGFRALLDRMDPVDPSGE
jgi:hypothetical protein